MRRVTGYNADRVAAVCHTQDPLNSCRNDIDSRFAHCSTAIHVSVAQAFRGSQYTLYRLTVVLVRSSTAVQVVMARSPIGLATAVDGAI